MMRLFVSFSLLLITSISSSQQQMGPYMAYGPEAGYFSGLNFSVYQSANGYLWIGTPNGVVRFDGKRYKNFFPDYSDGNSPSDNTIIDIAEDKNGELWLAGFSHGATRYNQRTGKFTKYPALSKDNFPVYTIYTIMKDSNDDMWFATGGRGLAKYIYNRDSFELYYPEPGKCKDGSIRGDNYVTDIIQDKTNKNILWCATFHGLFSFNKQTKQFEKYHSGLQDNVRDILINTIELDNNGNIWAGTWGEGLQFFSIKLKSFEKNKAKAFPSIVYDLKKINDSLIYAACTNDGLYELNSNNGQLKNITPPRNPTDPANNKVDIQKISITPEAGIFIGGNYYVYQQHPAYTRLKKNILYPDIKKDDPVVLLTGSVWDEKRQQYWITTDGGKGVYTINKDLQQILPVVSTNNSKQNHFHDLVIDALSCVWMLSGTTGVWKWDEMIQSVSPLHESLPVPDSLLQKVWRLAVDKEQNLWMMSGEKFIYWNVINDHVDVIPLQWDADYRGPHITQSAELKFDPDGNAWLITQSGLFQCKPKEKKVIHFYKTGNRKKDLASGSFLSGVFNKYKNFWITSGNGIQVYDWKNDTVQANHNLSGGLPSMHVTSLATDTSGKIWAGSVTGIMRFDPTKKIWQLFNRLDGMERDYLDGTMFIANNKLIIDQQNGLLIKDVNEIGTGSTTPALRITAIYINNVEHKDSVLPEFTDHIELPYYKNNIDIEFAAMDWLYPFKTKYRYKIEGEVSGIGFLPNTDGTGLSVLTPGMGFFPNTDGRLSLAGLQPGKYTIHIRALGSNGHFSKDIVFKIVIRQPFWQTAWFMLLCIVAIIVITWLLYRYRIRQLKKMYEIRSGIAKNLHDEIGSTLTSIKILSEVSQSNLTKDQSKASTLIQKITEQSAEMQQSMNDIVWAIQPDNDKLQNMVVRMREYLGHTLEPKNIQISFTAEKNVLTKSFGMKQRRDFFLIFKEAVNNAAKYSKCNSVDINLTLHQNNILLTIEDDGVGFDTNQVTSSNGLKNMRSRAESLHGTFAITSEPGKGTAIRLEVPAT
jgi:signal transduction histidine kinase/ligand-binding sensor domain-containing protein